MRRWLNVMGLLIATMVTLGSAGKHAWNAAKRSSADDYYEALSPAAKGSSNAAKMSSSASDYHDSLSPDVKAASAEEKGAKASSSSDYYQTDVDPTSGLDENGENYIPFQWQVEIIKREYDDYVLPDGTTYRVPKGALPPYRYKGLGPYNVPYSVFKSPRGHSDRTYNGKPKLVETWDKQLLELLMQSWYENAYWDRYLPVRQMPGDDYYPAATAEKTSKDKIDAEDQYYMTRFENKNRYRR